MKCFASQRQSCGGDATVSYDTVRFVLNDLFTCQKAEWFQERNAVINDVTQLIPRLARVQVSKIATRLRKRLKKIEGLYVFLLVQAECTFNAAVS